MRPRREFEKLVMDSLRSLPQHFQEKLDNVAVVIEDVPTAEQLQHQQVQAGTILLGLYEGVPKTQRDSGYIFVLPDKITIFQKPLEEFYRSDEDLLRGVQRTVMHEIAHHFGISDERLEHIGKY